MPSPVMSRFAVDHLRIMLAFLVLLMKDKSAWDLYQSVLACRRRRVPLNSASVYYRLDYFVQAGFMLSRYQERKGRRHQVFRLTPTGRRWLSDVLAELELAEVSGQSKRRRT